MNAKLIVASIIIGAIIGVIIIYIITRPGAISPIPPITPTEPHMHP